MNPILAALAARAGIHIVGAVDLQPSEITLALDGFGGLACDAQPALITTSNAGIPAYLSTYIDPKLIEILVAPMKAAEIVGGEIKKGDWLTETATFPVVESTGQTSSYGDYSENGNAGVNAAFPSRQSYSYQVMAQWGEKELERAGLAKIDWANRVGAAAALTLMKFQNKSYFFGVSGLQNYGLLNDPALSAAIAPTTKTAGGTTWAAGTGNEILNDIAKLYKRLQTQANGTIDRETPMVLAMSPIADADGLTKVTDYNVSVQEKIKKLYPNLEIRTAPEYGTTSGELVQLIAIEVAGQKTAECAFTEKMRAHPIVVAASSFKQKRSQGTWGCIIYRPAMIAQMIGV